MKEEKEMRVVKKIAKSRLLWFCLGLAFDAIVIANIPEGTAGNIARFIWSQKWGVLLGLGMGIPLGSVVTGLFGRAMSALRGLGGRTRRRDEEDEEDEDDFI